MATSLLYKSVLAAALALTVASAGASHAQTYTDLFNFNGTDGRPAWPQILAQGRDGDLYGTTTYGGVEYFGDAFKMTLGGSETVLYGFGGAAGNSPSGGLTLGTDGDFYGTTLTTIFRMAPDGVLTVLYTSTGGPTLGPGVIQGSDGTFYGTTSSETAYKITSSGNFTSLGALPGISAAPLLLATDGNFYGTTEAGGNSNNGTIFKLTPGGIVTVIYNFDFVHGAKPLGPLIQANDGNFYGTTIGGGARGGGVIFQMTPGGTLRVMHDLAQPSDAFAGLIQATDGNLYDVVHIPNTYGVIFEITLGGTVSELYAFDGHEGASPWATPMQHTNGKIYGLAAAGGAHNKGVLYRFDNSLAPFVRLVPSVGSAGRVIGFLGQGFTGTTAVSFNGIAATFNVESETYLTAIVPTGATSGTVSVTTPGGVLNSNQAFQIKP